jgi:WD40 repeat protein
VRQLKGHTTWVESIAFAPDGKTLASAGHEETIRLWDVATGKKVRQLKGHTTWVESIAFAPDGKTLLSGSRDWSVRLWDVATGKELRKYKPGVNAYTAVAFAPDGKTVAGAGLNGAIQLWDAQTGRPCESDRAPVDGWQQLSFLPGGKTLVTTGGEVVHFWEAATGKHLRALPEQGSRVAALAPSPDGEILAVSSHNGKIRLWRTTDGKELRQFAGNPNTCWGLTYTPDGRTLLSSRPSWAGKSILRVWDAVSGEELRQLKGVGLFALSPDGKVLAAGNPPNPVIRLLDLPTGKELRQINTGLAVGYNLAFGPGGKTLAAGAGWQGPQTRDDPSAVALWDVTTGKEVCRCDGHKGGVQALAISPDGRLLATGGVDGTLRLWEVATGKERHRLQGHDGLVEALSFSPDGTLLASASRDLTVLMWDVTGRLQSGGAALSDKDLQEQWNALAGEDAVRAYRAIRVLTAVPRQTVRLLKMHLRPVPLADARQIAQLIGDLNSGQFTVRDRATRELEKMGESAEPALRRALEGKAFAETQQRLQQLINKAERWTAERLQTWRAVEVLDHIGTPEARQVLQVLAKGLPEARLTRAAQETLERLSRRSGGKP